MYDLLNIYCFLQKFSGNLFQSFRKFVKEFFHFILFNYNHIKNIKNKHVLDKQLYRSLCFNSYALCSEKITCI